MTLIVYEYESFLYSDSVIVTVSIQIVIETGFLYSDYVQCNRLSLFMCILSILAIVASTQPCGLHFAVSICGLMYGACIQDLLYLAQIREGQLYDLSTLQIRMMSDIIRNEQFQEFILIVSQHETDITTCQPQSLLKSDNTNKIKLPNYSIDILK